MTRIVLDIDDPRRLYADLIAAVNAPGNSDTSYRLRGVCEQVIAQLPEPKPDEPTGLGAVAAVEFEDGKGCHVIRCTNGRWYTGDSADGGWYWNQFVDARVLSEGVTA